VAGAAAISRGLSRVAIVDVDVHHGNGTQWMFYDDPRILYISTHQFPFYPGTGAADEVGRGRGEGFTVNVPLEAGATDADYATAYLSIATILDQYAPELLLISAGYDAHDDDPLASMRLTTAGYAAVIAILQGAAARTRCPLALVTEGGYDLAALRGCLDVTLSALHDRHGPIAVASASPRAARALQSVRTAHARYWRGL
jgi:acetoin utilization deacetylase AcuC-like enzyme